MNKPTKKALYDEVLRLSSQVNELVTEREEEFQQIALKKFPQASKEFFSQMQRIFPNALKSSKFEHVDKVGFWFSFELINDSRRQTYCVKHTEIA